jgi:HAD superfamily hydrolase (TIGR01509 family)
MLLAPYRVAMPDSSNPIRAVLFDVDGTLVDSNYLHIDAWHRAFAEVDRPIDAWRIHRAIGMDSDRLLEELLGDDAADLGDAAKKRHAKAYKREQHRLRPFDGSRELITMLLDRGLTVVLATSAPQEELDVLLEVLDLDDDRLITTNADDVETAKPEPDIVHVALERAGVAAHEAVFVGDTVWDMVAATKAGVSTVGVQSGGVGPDELRDAGAGEVVRNVDELLARGSDWPAARRAGARADTRPAGS